MTLSAVSMAQVCHANDRDQPTLLTVTTRLDSATHLRTYSYTITNPSSNTAPIDLLLIKLEPGVNVITDIRSPPGWRVFYGDDKDRVMWAATEYFDLDREDPNGKRIPSDYAVSPGRSLAGFSFKSVGPPGPGLAITQSFAPIYAPQSDEELEALEASEHHSNLPEDNGFRISTTVPVPNTDWLGNRRPSVDGFLVFANVQDGATYSGSVLVVFRLGSAEEVVHADTLQVRLNGSDVTGMFNWSNEFKGYAATFIPGSSPLQEGRNVLGTSVEGVVPGSVDHLAKDTDRLSFNFTP